MYHAETELFSEPLIDYLRNRGWALMESEPDIAVLRKTFVDQEEEIILPRDRTYTDYRQRILEAIHSLAKYEHSSEINIIEDLLLQKWDILRIRIKGDRIGQKLKPQTEVNQNLFVGKVLTLHGEADEQGNMQGEATLVLLTDEQQTKAKVFLGSEFYSLACDAHKQNQYVRISGILSEKPRCSDLKDVSLFEVLR